MLEPLNNSIFKSIPGADIVRILYNCSVGTNDDEEEVGVAVGSAEGEAVGTAKATADPNEATY